MSKDKNLLKKQIKTLQKKNNFNFSIDKKLEDWQILKILRNSNILLFFQYNWINKVEDLRLLFIDQNIICKYIKKKKMLNIINPKIYPFIKNFNNVLSINNIFEISKIEKILLKQNILIQGYYLNNIYIYKKDLNIVNIEKKEILKKLKKFLNKIKIILINIIFILKIKYKKILFILKKKKNGNN